MNHLTQTPAPATVNAMGRSAPGPDIAPAGTRGAGLAFAAIMTLAMLLGVGTLAQVDGPAEQLAKAPAAASAPAAQS